MVNRYNQPRTKWRNTKVWLSDGCPVQYSFVQGKRSMIRRDHDTVVDSIKERSWFLRLLELQKNKKIHSLIHQVPFEIIPQTKHNGVTYSKQKFTIDFSFYTTEEVFLNTYGQVLKGIHVFLEIKSRGTIQSSSYKLRRHLFLELHISKMQDALFIEIVD